MAEYDDWAEYYDLIHPGLPGEAEFYTGQAVRIGGRTLELGCGTGRIAIPMAMSGVDVTGVDHSQAMLDVCGEKLAAVGEVAGRLTLVQADVGEMDLGATFDFIAMPYRTFMHALTPENQRCWLRAVHKHLADNGVFMLNLWAPRPSLIAPHLSPAAGALRPVDAYDLPDTGGRLIHHYAAAYDEDRQLISEEHVLHEVDEAGGVIGMTSLPMVRAWIYPREMDHLVRLCGFDVDALFGDFDCSPFTRHSKEMLWVLRKEGT